MDALCHNTAERLRLCGGKYDRNTSTKRILLIATGGTIASTEDGNGLSPALTGEELAQSVPEISGLCELDVV